jgi:hypothetical protein
MNRKPRLMAGCQALVLAAPLVSCQLTAGELELDRRKRSGGWRGPSRPVPGSSSELKSPEETPAPRPR